MKAEVLFGGKTRFAILEALTGAKQRMTAYQIAMAKGLDPAATYRAISEFLSFGVVESERKVRNQTIYKLSDGAGKAAAAFLRSVQQKQSESIDLEEWISPEKQAERMAEIVALDVRQPKARTSKRAGRKDVEKLLSRRAPGELAALVESSQIAFNEVFEQKDNVFILRDKK
jgi:Fe2+ or Zn2+ uptake regulation protein